MRLLTVTLYMLAGVALLGGVLFFGVSKSALHEIEALIALLIGAVCFAGGAVVSGQERIVEAINRGTTVAINEAKMGEIRYAEQGRK